MRTAYRYCNVAALVIFKINPPCKPPQLAASSTAIRFNLRFGKSCITSPKQKSATQQAMPKELFVWPPKNPCKNFTVIFNKNCYSYQYKVHKKTFRFAFFCVVLPNIIAKNLLYEETFAPDVVYAGLLFFNGTNG